MDCHTHDADSPHQLDIFWLLVTGLQCNRASMCSSIATDHCVTCSWVYGTVPVSHYLLYHKHLLVQNMGKCLIFTNCLPSIIITECVDDISIFSGSVQFINFAKTCMKTLFWLYNNTMCDIWLLSRIKSKWGKEQMRMNSGYNSP